MKCLFGNENEECNKPTCWGCIKVPDLDATEAGIEGNTQSLEYKLLSAVGEHRRRQWKDRENEVHRTDYPSWMNDVRIDHTKCFKGSNGEIFVRTEPYETDMETMERIIGVCKEKGLSFVITGDSVHFPGKTITVDIKKKGDKGDV